MPTSKTKRLNSEKLLMVRWIGMENGPTTPALHDYAWPSYDDGRQCWRIYVVKWDVYLPIMFATYDLADIARDILLTSGGNWHAKGHATSCFAARHEGPYVMGLVRQYAIDKSGRTQFVDYGGYDEWLKKQNRCSNV